MTRPSSTASEAARGSASASAARRSARKSLRTASTRARTFSKPVPPGAGCVPSTAASYPPREARRRRARLSFRPRRSPQYGGGAGDRRSPRICWPSVAALVLVIVQSLLGALVVGQRLRPVTVTVHLAVAMILFATLLYETVSTFCLRRVEKGVADAVVRPSYARLAAWGALVTFLLLLVGAYVRGENAGLAFPDWPLMNGRLIPHLGEHATAHFLHRLLAL